MNIIKLNTIQIVLYLGSIQLLVDMYTNDRIGIFYIFTLFHLYFFPLLFSRVVFVKVNGVVCLPRE